MPAPRYLLPQHSTVASSILECVGDDYRRYADKPLPARWEEYLADRYGLDLSTQYAGVPISNPWGKASGQLSMTAQQVEDDTRAGLGFIVLKTVIAQDEQGAQSMRDWAVKESRMVAEHIIGSSGETGWTISWKGRGWWQTFDDYLTLVRDARRIAGTSGPLIVPSCKFHLPTPEESSWKTDEYVYTTRRLLEAWCRPGSLQPMPLEKDFSPTLAGSDRAAVRDKIIEWLQRVPELIESSAGTGTTRGGAPVRLGLKIFNALFDDDFQLDMLRSIHQPGPSRPDFYVYGNRLFDPEREFDGKKGIAYGGPDLSERNLRIISRFREDVADSTELLPWSATGNICSGKMALEYALRGASSFQLHTFFQLPAKVYSKTDGNKTQKALHELYLHPETGLVVWMHHLAGELGLPTNPLRFHDVIGIGG